MDSNEVEHWQTRRRLCMLLGLAPFVGLAATGCGQSNAPTPASGTTIHQIAEGQTVRLAFVPNAPTAFWEMAEHGLKKFESETGIHVELLYPATGSVEEQNRILENLVNQNYSGVAMSVIAPNDQVREINRAAEHLNIVTTDSDAPASNRVAFIGPSQTEAGAAAGREIAALLPQGGQIALFCGDMTAQNAVERMNGIRSVIADKNIEIVATKEDGKDRTRARAQVEDVLNAFPGVDVLVGLWSYNGPAIRDALVARGQIGPVRAVAFDEEEGTLQGVAAGEIAATIVLSPFDYGYRSAHLLYDLARQGEAARPAEPIIDTGFRVIHAADVDALRAQLAEQARW